jgi:hypothetical protein
MERQTEGRLFKWLIRRDMNSEVKGSKQSLNLILFYLRMYFSYVAGGHQYSH